MQLACGNPATVVRKDKCECLGFPTTISTGKVKFICRQRIPSLAYWSHCEAFENDDSPQRGGQLSMGGQWTWAQQEGAVQQLARAPSLFPQLTRQW